MMLRVLVERIDLQTSKWDRWRSICQPDQFQTLVPLIVASRIPISADTLQVHLLLCFMRLHRVLYLWQLVLCPCDDIVFPIPVVLVPESLGLLQDLEVTWRPLRSRCCSPLHLAMHGADQFQDCYSSTTAISKAHRWALVRIPSGSIGQ